MKILIVSIYTLLCLIIEMIYLWLFPFTGLGGIICWPSTIIMTLISIGIFVFFSSNAVKSTKAQLLLIGVLFFAQINIQLPLIPQDYGGDVYSKINDAIQGYREYENIEYDNFPFLSTGERVAFIHKFQGNHPDSYKIITVEENNNNGVSKNSRTYMLQKNGRTLSYDRSKINLIINEDRTIISELLENGDTVTHNTDLNLENKSSGGLYHGQFFINTSEDDLRIKTGIEILLFKIFEIIKDR